MTKKLKEIPLDLFIDLAITTDLFAQMFNCNEETLEANGIDWAYLHKLNRRAQYFIENIEDKGDEPKG